MCLFHALEGLVLADERLELIVNDLERIADHVVLLLKCSERGED